MPWRNDREARRRSDATYNAQYRRNRTECLRRANWKCQLRIGNVCVGSATQADHIVAVADGGGNEVSNLRAACGPCHAARTAGQGNDARWANRSSDPPPSPRTAW
jgi:5-methylcytosine-specific restriction endonuclease McrA